VLQEFFPEGGVLVFEGVFAKNGVQEMVFWWLICGGTLVDDGQLMGSFWSGKIRHGFGIYF
jgi:hypothetical protein